MNYGGFSIIDGDRGERTRDDVTGFLSEKASRSESVNELKLTCESMVHSVLDLTVIDADTDVDTDTKSSQMEV